MTQIKNLFRKISALSWREGDIYVAKAVEFEIASQGKTKTEALSNLKEALELYFEDEQKTGQSTPYKDLTLENLDIRYA